ncbi:hypothetical protein [Flavobacterium sp.]|uniref:hypothetical protein n=1 Tax=Flavobacterium sp. TaxID=239 RepID=UPI00374CB10C
MSIKKVIAIGLVTGAVGYVLVKQKIDKLTKQFDSIKILPTGLSALKLDWNDFKPQLKFNCDLSFANPLTDSFEINGVVAKLQRIIILDATGKAIGVATPNVGKIVVPANGNYTLRNVPFVLDLQGSIINIVNYKLLTLKNLKFEAIVSILGAEYKIR